MSAVEDVHLTVVVDRPVAVYSGRVPAYIAGEIDRSALEIDVRPLARRAGAAVVVAAMKGIDRDRGRVLLEGRAPVAFDLCSVNIGSTVAGGGAPGVREYGLPSRPIGRFVAEVDRWLEEVEEDPTVAVVGGGAAGTELVLSVGARLQRRGLTPKMVLVRQSPMSGPLGAAVDRVLQERGIEVHDGQRAEEVTAQGLRLTGGTEIAADKVIWATGGASHGLMQAAGFPCTEAGFVRVHPTLQTLGDPRVFAVGDAAVIEGESWVPKAGVYAVRQGPFLAQNLEAALSGRPLTAYSPQKDFLALLNLGDGRALGSKWGATMKGRWVRQLKGRIDEAFMEKFQLLGAEGEPIGDLPVMADEMLCGGCAAKVDALSLQGALASVGTGTLAKGDDVAVVSVGAAKIAVTVDAFPAFTPDPWLVGRVAAVNALSDLYAKGSTPAHCLATLTIPRDAHPQDTLEEVLAGVQATLEEHGVTLAGGHTLTGPDLVVGLTVLADGQTPLWWQSQAAVGDLLVLSRPLGTGILWRADGLGLAQGAWMQEAERGMLAPVTPVVEAARAHGVVAATDVTGFGLGVHLAGMMEQAGTTARLNLSALPTYSGVLPLLHRGVRSTSQPANAAAFAPKASPGGDPIRRELLVDPQTAGGLLLCVPPSQLEALKQSYQGPLWVIGEVVDSGEYPVEVV